MPTMDYILTRICAKTNSHRYFDIIWCLKKMRKFEEPNTRRNPCDLSHSAKGHRPQYSLLSREFWKCSPTPQGGIILDELSTGKTESSSHFLATQLITPDFPESESRGRDLKGRAELWKFFLCVFIREKKKMDLSYCERKHRLHKYRSKSDGVVQAVDPKKIAFGQEKAAPWSASWEGPSKGSRGQKSKVKEEDWPEGLNQGFAKVATTPLNKRGRGEKGFEWWSRTTLDKTRLPVKASGALGFSSWASKSSSVTVSSLTETAKHLGNILVHSAVAVWLQGPIC